jgi:hypothetical protein
MSAGLSDNGRDPVCVAGTGLGRRVLESIGHMVRMSDQSC